MSKAEIRKPITPWTEGKPPLVCHGTPDHAERAIAARRRVARMQSARKRVAKRRADPLLCLNESAVRERFEVSVEKCRDMALRRAAVGPSTEARENGVRLALGWVLGEYEEEP